MTMAPRTQQMVLGLVLLCVAQNANAQVVAPPNSQPARSVTLTLAEYNRLLDLANRPVTAPPAAPVAAVLSNAEMRIRVDGSTATGTFILAGQVLRSGVNRVTLLSDATVLDASVDGHPLPLLVDGRSHQALLTGPGPFTATLEWGPPVIFKPSSLMVMARSGFLGFRKALRQSGRHSLDSTRPPRTSSSAMSGRRSIL
jgi:hypothetical protein